MTEPMISLTNLRVYAGKIQLLHGIELDIHAGECVALVGESGSGKSLTAKALVGLLPENLDVDFDDLRINTVRVNDFSERQWQHIRGKDVGFIVQDALSALDPLRKIVDEVTEALTIHERLPKSDKNGVAVRLLEEQHIPESAEKVLQYPGQLSGGQRQRALIASVFATQPKVIIADEPTASLDTTLAAQQLDTLGALKQQGFGILLISHDLGAVAGVADRVHVLQTGRMVESGSVTEVLENPHHPYTQRLVESAKRLSLDIGGKSAGSGEVAPVADQPSVLVNIVDVKKSFPKQQQPALSGIDLQVISGQNLGIAGQSGSGKTTLIRTLLGLEEPDHGMIEFLGSRWSHLSERQRRSRRHSMQWVPQDAYSSMNPRWSTQKVLGEAIKNAARLGLIEAKSRTTQLREILRLMELVGLPPHTRKLNTVNLSGGQRQRLALARSLAMRPEVLILDEAFNALDVSIQVQMIDVLKDIQQRVPMTVIVISHDLATLQELSDQIIILDAGEIVESGRTKDVLMSPKHSATQLLVQNARKMG